MNTPIDFPIRSRGVKPRASFQSLVGTFLPTRRSICLLVLSLGLLSLATHPAAATNRTVTNVNDSGAGSLRQAIADSAAGDTINFSVTGTITLTSGALLVSKTLTINGPGALSLTIAGGTTFGVFNVSNGTNTGPTVAISGLLIENGGQTEAGIGGGVYNDHGSTTLNDCEIDYNRVGITNYGYGTNFAAMTINNCTIAANTGGGIENNGGSGGDAELNLANCTIYGNGGSGINSEGNGYFSAILSACTIAYNSGYNISGTCGSETACQLTTGNTIFAASSPTAANFGPSYTIISNGYNLFTDPRSYYPNYYAGTSTGDQFGVDPQLDPNGPQYNGGFTRTVALTFYGTFYPTTGTTPSPAIDHGSSLGLTTDQRGQARTYDNPNVPNGDGSDGTDIGAYEAPSDPIQAGIPSLVVTTTADHNDGVCGGFDCTLREAIQAANASATAARNGINFAQGVTGTITVQSPLVVGGSYGTIIYGPGARSLEISGGGAQRIFYASVGQTYISGLTLGAGTYATTQNHGEARQGGAIYNTADLTLDQCALVNNSVIGAINVNNGGNGGAGQGGAIFNGGNLNLNYCTFSGNSATGAAGNTFTSGNIIGPGGNGGAGQGGVVFNDGAATLSVTNCTFNGNTASGGNGGSGNSGTVGASGGSANGGAVCNLGMMYITSATVSGNTGTGGAGAAFGFRRHGPNGSGNGGLSAQSGSSDTVANTLCAANSGTSAPDAEGTFSSNGYNLIGIGDQSSGWRTDFSDQVGTTAAAINPQLGSLQNNGGPTDTMAPLTGSPAIDQGYSFGLSTDQRGYYRPFDDPYVSNASDGSDIGAFELNLVSPTGAVSRKTHGSAGPFDIALPLSGTSGIECRSGGGTGDHQLIVTFPTSVSITGSPQAQVTTGTGQIGTGGGVVTLDQTKTIVTVPLTSVANAQRIVVTLFSVSDGVNTNNVTIPIGVLLGDVNGSARVDAADVSLVRQQTLQTVGSSNFREDINLSGRIDAADVSVARQQTLTSLP